MSKIREIFNKLTLDRKGDFHQASNFGMMLGVVVDTDDPLQMGRLRIYCPELNDDPKKVQFLPWAAYVSPFGGSINNPSHVKGHPHSSPPTTDGTTQYGFWAIPEKGANVLVACINGDARRRIWMGCLYEHKETAGVLTNIYDWDKDGPDGPHCSPTLEQIEEGVEPSPVEPLYTNQKEAFGSDVSAPEWKSRGADYAGMVNVDIENSGTNAELQQNEKDSWVKEKLGALGYDWTGFKNLGAYMASKVFGFMSPGQHTLTFDDRPFNSRIKLRTTAGHQIILDDTNERIYINTYEGKSWIELDVNGNIDIFAERRLSVHSEKDLNLSSDETVRIKGNKGVYLYAGNAQGQRPLDSTPPDGQIRFHAQHDIHMKTDSVYRHFSKSDTKFEIEGTYHTIAKDDWFQHGRKNIYTKAEETIFIKTPTNTVSLDPLGVTNASSGNVVLNAGQQLIMAANLGPIVSNTDTSGDTPFALSLDTDLEEVFGLSDDLPRYGLDFGDFGCDVPANGALFSMDVSGNINMQTMVDTYIKRKTENFSTSIKEMNEHVNEFKDRYNETISSLTQHLLDNEIAQYAMQAAGAVSSTAGRVAAFVAMKGLIKPPPTLKELTASLKNSIGFFDLPNLGLPDLCAPPVQTQKSFAFEYGSIDINIQTPGPLSLDSPNIKFGAPGEAALPSDIELAPWTNRVPEHEPWPRVMKQDSGDTQNQSNDGYKDNVAWDDQFTNEGDQGRKDIGVIEGDDTNERGDFWRR